MVNTLNQAIDIEGWDFPAMMCAWSILLTIMANKIIDEPVALISSSFSIEIDSKYWKFGAIRILVDYMKFQVVGFSIECVLRGRMEVKL